MLCRRWHWARMLCCWAGRCCGDWPWEGSRACSRSDCRCLHCIVDCPFFQGETCLVKIAASQTAVQMMPGFQQELQTFPGGSLYLSIQNTVCRAYRFLHTSAGAGDAEEGAATKPGTNGMPQPQTSQQTFGAGALGTPQRTPLIKKLDIPPGSSPKLVHSTALMFLASARCTAKTLPVSFECLQMGCHHGHP